MGQKTKMAAMPLCGKTALETFCSGTDRPIAIELGILHSGLIMPVTMYSNNDCDLTFFTPKSNLFT